MAKTLIGAILLIGIGIGAGFVHARLNKSGANPVPLTLQNPQALPETKPSTTDTKPANEQPPAPPPVAPPQAEVPKPVAPAPAVAPQNDMFITIARAKELYDQKARGQWDGIFIDSRPFHDYTAGHIPGSMHVDKKYFDGAVPKKVRDYLPGLPVVIYCHGENCTDSEAVAARLIALKRSIGPIYIIKDGYPGWTKAGYPVDQGGEVGFE